MKKRYEKPQIVFEDFTLSTNIAGNCEMIVDNPVKGSCGIPGSMPGANLFSAGVVGDDGCRIDWAGLMGDNYDGFCYHVPTDSKNLFNS